MEIGAIVGLSVGGAVLLIIIGVVYYFVKESMEKKEAQVWFERTHGPGTFAEKQQHDAEHGFGSWVAMKNQNQ